MSLKYFKRIFIAVIILLIIAGIYIIYIKDNGNLGDVQAQNRETAISKDILIGITDFDTINPILTKNLEIQHLTKLIYEPLINITQDFNTEPGIAEEWSKIDELTYIVKLDENKKWEIKEGGKYFVTPPASLPFVFLKSLKPIASINFASATTPLRGISSESTVEYLTPGARFI